MGVIINCTTGEEIEIDDVPLPLEDARAQKLDELASRRWLAETAGIVVEGMPIKTDRESQALLNAAYTKAKDDPEIEIIWKAAPGVHVPVSAAEIVVVGDAVFAHVQGCFAREGVLAAEITAAADHEALTAIDLGAGWP